MSVVDMLGPEFNKDCWFSEKFNLGLDFPNVGDIYVHVHFCSLILIGGDIYC